MSFFENLENKIILYQDEEQKNRINEKLKLIPNHSILNLNFLHHFLFIIFETLENELLLRLYKKNYDFEKKEWNNNEINLMSSLSLNFGEPENSIYNIEKIETIEDTSILDFMFYYPYDVKPEEVEFFNYQKYNACIIDSEFEESTLLSQWGYKVNYKDIRWMMNIETMINSNYGVGDTYFYKFRSNSFKKMKFIDIYYEQIIKDSVIYKKIVNSVSFICDLCQSHFENIENKELWHNNLFGDLCDECMLKKINRENYRKNLLKDKILLLGKRKRFEKELIKTKLILADITIPKLSSNKKELLLKRLFKNTLVTLDNQYHNCSICLENMEGEIYTGSCGHCFHKKCALSLPTNECPLCRVQTKFFKLYFD